VKTSPLHEPSPPHSLHTAGVVCFHPARCQPHCHLRQARAPDATPLCVPMCRAPTGHPHHLPSATAPVTARLPWVVQSWLLRTACLCPSLCCHAHIAAALLSAAQHLDTQGQPLPTRCPRASLLAPPVAHAPSWRRAIPSRACGPPAPLPHGVHPPPRGRRCRASQPRLPGHMRNDKDRCPANVLCRLLSRSVSSLLLQHALACSYRDGLASAVLCIDATRAIPSTFLPCTTIKGHNLLSVAPPPSPSLMPVIRAARIPCFPHFGRCR
jgi:hypothetical protein